VAHDPSIQNEEAFARSVPGTSPGSALQSEGETQKSGQGANTIDQGIASLEHHAATPSLESLLASVSHFLKRSILEGARLWISIP
jgi:hypothetical protein